MAHDAKPRIARPRLARAVLLCVMAALVGCALPPSPRAPVSEHGAFAPPKDGVQTQIRGQDPTYPAPPSFPNQPNQFTPGSQEYTRQPMQPSGQPQPPSYPSQPYQGQPNGGPVYTNQPGPGFENPSVIPPGQAMPPFDSTIGDPGLGGEFVQPGRPVPFNIYVEEERTGRFMFGMGVNSDAGVTGQITIDERNFDITRVPTSWSDFANGTAFRGAGQGFRIEAMPGTLVQRYLVSFTEPYLMDTPLSLNVSGFLFDRRYQDWDEQRLGGRLAVGYRLTHDLSFTGAVRAEHVDIHDPSTSGIPELDPFIGEHDLFSGKTTLTHDTRDAPFLPTQGHLLELSFEQVFGSFDYPRAEIDYRRYFLIRERADGSGRHTLGASIRMGYSGAQTPIFENYFAGGFSTLRGFDFRGASPVSTASNFVTVGGQFQLLGSLEYIFPLTADDMIRGVLFCDYGTVERKMKLYTDSFRVAPGFGLRVAIPALGPAPLALDFAFPVNHADTDELQVFSFFFGFGR